MAKKIIPDVPNFDSGPSASGNSLFFIGAAAMFAVLFFAGKRMERKNVQVAKNPAPGPKPAEPAAPPVAVSDAGSRVPAAGSRTAWLDGVRR